MSVVLSTLSAETPNKVVVTTRETERRVVESELSRDYCGNAK